MIEVPNIVGPHESRFKGKYVHICSESSGHSFIDLQKIAYVHM
jgi:hypothetical protein